MKAYASGASTYIWFVALPRHFSKAAPITNDEDYTHARPLGRADTRTVVRTHGRTHGRTYDDRTTERATERWSHYYSLEWRRRLGGGGGGPWIKGAQIVFFFSKRKILFFIKLKRLNGSLRIIPHIWRMQDLLSVQKRSEYIRI